MWWSTSLWWCFFFSSCWSESDVTLTTWQVNFNLFNVGNDTWPCSKNCFKNTVVCGTFCHKSMLMMSYLLGKGCTIAVPLQLTAHLMLESTQSHACYIYHICHITEMHCIAELCWPRTERVSNYSTTLHRVLSCSWVVQRRVMTQWPSRSLSREAQHAVDCLQTFQVWRKYLSLLADKEQ